MTILAEDIMFEDIMLDDGETIASKLLVIVIKYLEFGRLFCVDAQ